TYHLPESEIEHLPKGTEIEFGKEWDGHTADDVLNRLLSLRPKGELTHWQWVRRLSSMLMQVLVLV
ncbi:hypothetical protein MJM04_28085, partial [Salmonella enterica subsp. enterica serovar Cerro]|nr:hypothetical protein [Salmonella enterica subsp. enterica serovar Cerro]